MPQREQRVALAQRRRMRRGYNVVGNEVQPSDAATVGDVTSIESDTRADRSKPGPAYRPAGVRFFAFLLVQDWQSVGRGRPLWRLWDCHWQLSSVPNRILILLFRR